MNIAEYAENHAVTPQAIYARLKKAGIKLDTIVDQNKTITEDGMKRLNLLYDEQHKQEQIKADSRIAQLTDKLLTAQKRITELQTALAAMSAQLSAQKDQTAKVEELLERERRMTEAWQEQAQIIKLLAAKQEQRPGFFQRIASAFRKG